MTSITLENEIWFQNNVFQQHMATYGYLTLAMAYVLVLQTKEAMPDIPVHDSRGVYVFNSMTCFKQMPE